MTWEQRLNNPPIPGSPEHNDLIELAGNWYTCAVGETQRTSIFNSHTPYNTKLKELGCAFSFAINQWKWEAAKEILKEIKKYE